MNEELKSKLIAALELKGLGKGMADFISITDESQIETAVASVLASVPTPKKMTAAEMIAEREVQSEIDRRVTAALAKAGKKTEAETPDKGEAEPPAWVKALTEQNAAIQAELTAIKSGKIIETKQQEAKSLLDKSTVLSDSVKSKWLNRIDVNSEIAIPEQISALEAEFTELRQSVADSTPLSGPVPSGSPLKVGGKEIENLVDKMLPTI